MCGRTGKLAADVDRRISEEKSIKYAKDYTLDFNSRGIFKTIFGEIH